MDARTTPRPSRPPDGDFSPFYPASRFVGAVRRVTLRPGGFVAAIPRRGNPTAPVLFALIGLEISMMLRGLLRLTGAGPEQEFGAFVGRVLLAPVVGILALLVGTVVLHLLVRMIVGKGNSGFEATLRVHSYAWVTNLVAWIPVVGSLLSLYAVYLAFVGIREVHETTSGKAALVVLIPVGAVLLLALLALITLGDVPWRS
jgi:hypothetical protein